MCVEYTCPGCKTKLEINSRDGSGNCPVCNKGYYFYEDCTEDYSDCWDCIEWD